MHHYLVLKTTYLENYLLESHRLETLNTHLYRTKAGEGEDKPVRHLKVCKLRVRSAQNLHLRTKKKKKKDKAEYNPIKIGTMTRPTNLIKKLTESSKTETEREK